MNGKKWTRDELLLAINLYCKIPFGRIHVRNPEIIELAEMLGRSPGSVSYKLANFASIDPSLDRKGAANVSKLDREVWSEFFADWEEMAVESEAKLLELKEKHGEVPELDDLPEGKTRETVVRARVNQSFFRKMILSSYDFRCCVTGLPIESLLVASHIVPWSVDEDNRMNPRNGLCLNALHDKAFDSGWMTFDESWRVVLSRQIHKFEDEAVKMLSQYEGRTLSMPRRFLPDQAFLAYHRERIFRS